MALIAMAVHDTEENGRSGLTEQTLFSLFENTDWNRHRLIIVDNNSCAKTKELYQHIIQHNMAEKIIFNSENLGTAEAINRAWIFRKPGENCIKMDNDVIIKEDGRWIDDMEEAIRREPKIGQVGLKRKDLWESPERTDFYKSELIMLPHQPGERWMVVEKVNHVMGTCQMYSSALLDKIGYLYQPRLYGFDDSLASVRSHLAGFISVFLPHIEIDHIDPGGTPYQTWKENHAGEQWQEYHKVLREYREGTRPIYYNPFNK
jgi:GT2 family glycosyltransferase